MFLACIGTWLSSLTEESQSFLPLGMNNTVEIW